MSQRVFESVHSTIGSIARRTPKKGFKQTLALSQLSRVDWLVRQCKTLFARAQCVASAIGSCRGDKIKVCNSECASIMLSEGPEASAVWKSSNDPISVKVSEEGIELSSKDYRLRIAGSKLYVSLPGTGGRVEKEVSLEDVEDLYANLDYVKHTMRSFELEVENMLRNLALCARAHARACP
ncbi:MAG: hypothetical protein N3F67_01700 [Acidilobaceae archaeon]|nr:hypothetical protein [Acidilobaceae archaeon]